ncbi:MAG TPA: SDR family NAD(P)-dependent oxidoreductase, partial [Nevskiales bacterium]|nr:SDR family NAD(P)-dependent oxidoreductase [Nevskiales bacterium]
MSEQHTTSLAGRTALITGGARRLGAAIAETLHAAGMNIALHYRYSRSEAEALAARLEALRPDSMLLLAANLRDSAALGMLVRAAAARWRRLDLLVNNASAFYPTPLDTASEAQWEDLIGCNLKAPFFLAQAAAPHLRASGG